MTKSSTHHYEPDAYGPLTLRQKRRLVQLARRAWEHRGSPGPSFDEWRHQTAVRACGLRISEGTQRDWASLKAAFLSELGEGGLALKVLLHDHDNPRRIALYKLTNACHERGLPLAYPSAICRRQYRCSLFDASASQLWRLLFTIRNRTARIPPTSAQQHVNFHNQKTDPAYDSHRNTKLT